MTGNIFNKIYLSAYIESIRLKLTSKVDSIDINVELNDVDLISQLKSNFTIEPLELKDAIPTEPREVPQIERDKGRAYLKNQFEIDVNIPFIGNKELFDCIPSRSTIVYIREKFEINKNNIKISFAIDDLDADKYQSQINKFVSDISKNIPVVNSEIVSWNDGLEDYIKSLIETRKGVVSKKNDFMEKIGLKVNPNSNEFMIPPQIAKKTIPVPVSETTKEVKKEYIPILQEEVYKDIITVLYNVGKAIERKPSIYIKKHEEDLRDIFLLFLETRYDSTSGVGEAFNKKGKTDILLKYSKDGTNIFVAECKFWKGQKKLLEAIDQLLGYLTHRDSKTALLLFVDQKEFSSVVATAKEEIKNHPQFKRFVMDTYEHSISYEFVLKDDSQKIIQIEVMLFHFPPVK